MHIITQENYGDAADAVRDILMMYVDLADGYQGFGHASDVHIRFDPLKFIDADVDGEPVYYVDLDLVRAGSAVAILCAFYDLWCEEQPLAEHHRTIRYQAAVNQGRLSAFPDIEAIVREAIVRNEMSLNDPWFEDAVVPIYRKYVLGLFRRLAASDRTSV